jgi:hypothetical protein
MVVLGVGIVDLEKSITRTGAHVSDIDNIDVVKKLESF